MYKVFILKIILAQVFSSWQIEDVEVHAKENSDESIGDLKVGKAMKLLKLANHNLRLATELQTYETRDELTGFNQTIVLKPNDLQPTNPRPNDCVQAAKEDDRRQIYLLQIERFNESPVPLSAYCENKKFGGGWTVIQRRLSGQDRSFYHSWQDYKIGFGSLRGSFFIGLQNLHDLTSNTMHELMIILKTLDEKTKVHAKYDAFIIGSENEGYALKALGEYTGTAGNSLDRHQGCKFSTYDRDNDESFEFHCAKEFKSGWWFAACVAADLNSVYENEKKTGILWAGKYYFSSVMMIRPRHYGII